MNRKSQVGKFGEDIAAKYLESKKYRILERNHRQKWGEIDIVALDRDGILVLVEVKTVNASPNGLTGEDQMTSQKLAKFKRAAYVYANRYFENRDDSKGWRLDLITVTLTDSQEALEHYENVS